MAYDAAVTRAVRLELATRVTRARIERISQPGKNEVALYLVKGRDPVGWLILSADARRARVHITRRAPRNPASPPRFCMALRKYLEGGRISQVNQPGLERVITLAVSNPQASLPSDTYVLVAEIMGKHSNILLVEPGNNVIIEAIKHYGSEVSRYRQVFPGQPYLPPPPEHKTSPLEVESEDDFAALILSGELARPLPEALREAFAATSPLVAREVVARAGLPPETRVEFCGAVEFHRLWKAFSSVWEEIEGAKFCPTLVRDRNGQPRDFSALDLHQYAAVPKEHWPEVNALVDFFFSWQAGRETFARTKADLERLVKKQLRRVEEEIRAQQEREGRASQAQQWQEYGEITKANLYRLQGREEVLEAENFFDPACPVIRIPLDPALSPVENAQAYFRRYQKAGRTIEAARKRLARLAEEKVYLESVLVSLEEATEVNDLLEIRRELAAQQYLPPDRQAPRRPQVTSEPLKVLSSDDLVILVGRNNRQNDRLSLRLARPDDYWLHAQGIPGAHVIIQKADRQEVGPTTLEEAALLAAYFSRAREAGKVPVDYTRAQHVWKPQGARPGMVLYDHQQTLVVRLDPERVNALLLK